MSNPTHIQPINIPYLGAAIGALALAVLIASLVDLTKDNPTNTAGASCATDIASILATTQTPAKLHIDNPCGEAETRLEITIEPKENSQSSEMD